MRKKAIHVVPTNNGWNVERDNAQRPSKNFNNKNEAQDYAINLAKQDKTELYIHKKDGTIGAERSYGNDPCPPKDKD